MKQISITFIFVLTVMNFLLAQAESTFLIPKAISFETQALARGERDDRVSDRGGYGMNLIIGTVHRSEVASRFRFTPALEFGVVSMGNVNEDNQTNSYASLNITAQYDIVRIKNYSIPFYGGVILDTSFKRDETAIFNTAIRMGFSSRIESVRSRNAFEFFNIGFTVSTNIDDEDVGFGAFYMGILKVEHKF